MLSVIETARRLRTTPAHPDDDSTFVTTLPDSSFDPAIVGRWRHFKGGEYEFLGVVEDLVLYHDAGGSMWLRPRSMIGEIVTLDGQQQRRFTRIVTDRR
jgi:hypothetical protein